MIIWMRRRNWVKRAMKSLDINSEKYRLLDKIQFTIKILVNSWYGVLV